MHRFAVVKVSVLKATHRGSITSNVVVHIGIVTAKFEVVGGDTNNRTAPIVTAGPNIIERTIAVEAIARQGQFQW